MLARLRKLPRPRRGPSRPPDGIPTRPRLLPGPRWARWALVFLLALTFLRGIAWDVTIPSFHAPDEDYHFLYVDHIAREGELIDRQTLLYNGEYSRAAEWMLYDQYGMGPRSDFSGDPKASVRRVERLPDSEREGTILGRGVGVVHPPLYHLLAVPLDLAAGDKSIYTRLFWVRAFSALIGVLAVFGAWLLAAQVFRHPAAGLLAAFVVCVQPMLSFLSAIANHDIAVIAIYSLVLAFLLFLLRTPPTPRQGLWLGGLLAAGLLVKPSILMLLPLAGLTLIVQALVHGREARGTVLRSAAWTLALVAVFAGPWYLFSLFETSSPLGNTMSTTAGATPNAGDGSLEGKITGTREWLGLTYRTYWFNSQDYEAPRGASYYHLPMFIGLLGMACLAGFFLQRWRGFMSREDPMVRQATLLVIAAVTIILPFLLVDLDRRAIAYPPMMYAGRYLLPAYAGVVVLFMIGVRHVLRPAVWPLGFGGFGLVAAWFGWKVYAEHYAFRYHGIELPFGPWPPDELLRRISFDRPEFVNPTVLHVLFILIALAGLGFLVAVAAGVIGRPPWLRVPRRRPLRRRRQPAAVERTPAQSVN